MPRHYPLSKRYDRRCNKAYGVKREAVTPSKEYRDLVISVMVDAEQERRRKLREAKLAAYRAITL